MNKFGHIIKTEREKQGLLLRHVAASLDVDQSLISNIENGKKKAKEAQVKQIADYLKLDEKELMMAWKVDKLLSELGDDEDALETLKLAESEIKYQTKQKRDSYEKRTDN